MRRRHENPEDKESWLQDPFTIEQCKVLEGEVRRRYAALVSAASGSQDPSVIRAYERYHAAKQAYDLFSKPARGRHDGD